MRKMILPALIALGLLTAGHARADVFGRLRVRIKVASGQPSGPTAGTSVTLRDTAGVRGDVTLTMGGDGTALSPPLESRAWRIVRVSSAVSGPDMSSAVSGPDSSAFPPIQVAADTTTDVTLTVDPARHRVVGVADGDGTQTALVYRRDRDFIRKYPVTAGDPQRLGPVLRTVPGLTR